MPKITEYEATNVGLQPTEVGIHATEAYARRINAAYNEAADVTAKAGHIIGSGIEAAGEAATKYITDQQISHGAAAFAGLQAKSIQDWNDANKNADPNNPTVAKNFLDTLEGNLQTFKGGFFTKAGQDWAEHHIETLRTHMWNKATADRSRASGEASNVNLAQTTNNLAIAAFGDPNDKGPELQFNTIDTSIPTKAQDDARRSVVMAAANGYMQQNGKLPPWIKDPKYGGYIDDINKLATTAKHWSDYHDTKAKAQEKEQEHIVKQDFDKKVIDINKKLIPVNNESTPQLPTDYWDNVETLTNHPGANKNDITRLIRTGKNITERLNKPETLSHISAANTQQIFNRMRLPDNDPQRITAGPEGAAQIDDAYGRGDLTVRDRNFLHKELLNRTTDEGKAIAKDRGEFLKRFANTIDPGLSVGLHTALGQQQMYLAETDAIRQEGALKAKGQDPHSLYDPASPNYLGKDISKYAKSMAEANAYDAALRKGQAPPSPAGAPAAPAPAVPADYDYAGATAAGVKPDERGHLPDTYKLPNHITFSDDSKYSNAEHQGGHWEKRTDGGWDFTAGPENLKQHSTAELVNYFNRFEPDSHLIIRGFLYLGGAWNDRANWRRVGQPTVPASQ